MEIKSLVEPPELASKKENYVKVKLSYLTPKSKHIRNLLLQSLCGVQPPYIEEVSILKPQSKVFYILENYMPHFDYLQKSGVVPKKAELKDFSIKIEDDTTLSYVFD